MDPASILGAVSASGAILAGIAKTVHALHEVRDSFHGADISIGLLISELSAVKAAVTQIEDWAKYNFPNCPLQADLGPAFQDSLEGCKIAMGVLSEEVESMLEGMSPEGTGFRFRAQYVWNESIMREHQQRLHTQVGALQLLIQVVQIRTLPGQAAFLREPKSRQILQKVKEDTLSLRTKASLSQTGSDIAVSRTESIVGSTVFDMDRVILNTEVYRNVGARMPARRGEQEARQGDISHGSDYRQTNALPGGHILGTRIVKSPGSPTSGEYPSPSIQSPDEWAKPLPYEKSIASEPVRKFNLGGRPAFHVSSVSDSGPQGFRKPSGTKTSIWGAIKHRGSRLSLTGQKPLPSSRPTNPWPESRGRRRAEDGLHRSIEFTAQDGLTTPLIVRAAQSGSCREIEELLDQRADIEDIHASSGRTALAVAAHCGNEDIVQLLLQYGARVDVADASSLTPLHLAASRGHYRVVESLLQERADIDAVCSENKTPLRLASDNGYGEVAALLLQRRAKVNARDRQQLTALHAAAKRGDGAMVNVLLAYGADVEAKDGSFMAAIHHAAEAGYDAIVETLLNKKANIECQGKESMTHLACAASSGSTEVAKLLIRRKASVRHRCEGDMTPLHWASYNGHAEVVGLLLGKRVATDARQLMAGLHFI